MIDFLIRLKQAFLVLTCIREHGRLWAMGYPNCPNCCLDIYEAV